MPGTVVSTRHTLKHNAAAFAASGQRIERKRRREVRSRGEQEKRQGIRMREQETDCVGRNRGNTGEEEEREEETKADTDNIYQHSRNMGQVYHYK